MTDIGSGLGDDPARPGLDPATWRLAVVAGVRMELPGEYPEVLVHEAVAPWRELAIPVGMADGNAIAYAWRSLSTPRPLTHALFTDVLERHEVRLEAVRITARRGRSYFAELDTTGPRGRQIIPCRPSDAFALVLRQRMPTPVLVADWVFDPEEQDIETPASGADSADDDAGDGDAAMRNAAVRDAAVSDGASSSVDTTEKGSAPGPVAGTQPTQTPGADPGPSQTSPDQLPTDVATTDGPVAT
jgi:bifunctional DNase/RNase